jgi:hypothetical protein
MLDLCICSSGCPLLLLLCRDSQATQTHTNTRNDSTNEQAIMSRFWAGAGSSDDSSGASDASSSVYSSDEEGAQGVTTAGGGGGAAGENRWLAMSDSDSSEDAQRVVKSGKERALLSFKRHISALRVHMKARDYFATQNEFDELCKDMIKAKQYLADGVPRPLVRILVDLEDYVAARLSLKDEFKKLSARQGRALNRLKLTLKKHNKAYKVVMDVYRLDPVVSDGEEEADEKSAASASSSGPSSDSSSSSSSSSSSDSDDDVNDKKKKKKVAIKIKDDNDDDDSDNDDDDSVRAPSCIDRTMSPRHKDALHPTLLVGRIPRFRCRVVDRHTRCQSECGYSSTMDETSCCPTNSLIEWSRVVCAVCNVASYNLSASLTRKTISRLLTNNYRTALTSTKKTGTRTVIPAAAVKTTKPRPTRNSRAAHVGSRRTPSARPRPKNPRPFVPSSGPSKKPWPRPRPGGLTP